LIQNVDLNDDSSYFESSLSSIYLIKGQISIIRYRLILGEKNKIFNFKMSFESASLSPDTFEIQQFFIARIGADIPCSSRVPETFTEYIQNI
jgi:hypothetical protein